MSPVLPCHGCGKDFDLNAEDGCWLCVTCEACTPDAGNCLDCRDMRAETEADKAIRYAIENEVCS